MNVSPFKSAEEFLAADGAIYSFADSPGFLYLMTGLTVAITIYLVVSAYTIHHD